MPYLSRLGTRIYYESEGEGPAIVLQTGAAGDLSMWRRGGYTSGPDGFRRILIDHRGHGKSDRPNGAAAYRIEEYRDDVIAVMDDLGERVITFLGYSHGSKVGCALALDHPERVAGLIDLDGLEPFDRSSPPSRQAGRALAEAVRHTGLAAKVREWAADESYSGPDWFLESLAGTDPRVFGWVLDGEGDWKGPASGMPQLTIPVLSLGSASRPPEEVARRRALLPTARTVVIPDVGHLGIFARPDLLLPEIRRFAAEVTGAARNDPAPGSTRSGGRC
jgi:pimeloyl-ACP methyl ester carboxylesterase